MIQTSVFVRRISWSSLLAVVFVAFASQSAKSQEIPRFFIERQGPRQNVWQLAWSANSQRLYACGFDKQVHLWDVGWNQKPEINEPDKITFINSLRWEIARGPRGSIRTMALSPANSTIAIAGVGARAQTGDIVLIDETTGAVLTSLPLPAERVQNQQGSGHTEPVLSLDFSPSGNRLLSTDLTGQVILWNATDNPRVWTRTVLQPSGTEDAWPKKAKFIDEQNILFARGNGDNREVVRMNVATRTSRIITEPHEKQVGAITIDLTNRFWASAVWKGNVWLRDPQTDKASRNIRSQFAYISDIAVSHNMIAVVSNEHDVELGRGVLELFDVTNGQKIDAVEVTQSSFLRAVSFTPDSTRLATHDPETSEVIVYRLRNQNGALIANPLSGHQPARTRGRIRRLTKPLFAADGKGIWFSREESNQPFKLDFKSGQIEQHANQGDVAPIFTGGWNSRIDVRDASFVDLINRGAVVARIQLDPIDQGKAVAVQFIPDKNGNPQAVAIGTTNINGIFIYSLPKPNQPPRLMRYLRDHNDAIEDINVSPDGQLLVSTSEDETIKLWSLSNLDWQPAGFPNASTWGAAFTNRGNQVVVSELLPDGRAAGLGLEVGDRIDRIQGYAAANQNQIIDSVTARDGAAKTLDTLRNVSILKQSLVIATSQQGKEKKFVIVPASEPLISAIIDKRNEWAIWTPTGYFNASAAEGGDLFGWQFNQGQDQTPRVINGGSFQKDFERPDVIQSILSNGTIAGAFAQIAAPLPLSQIAEQIPEIRIIKPGPDARLIADQPTEIVATIHFIDNRDAAFKVRGMINGQFLGEPIRIDRQANALGTTHTYTWSATARDDLNRIQVIANESGGVLNSLFATNERYYRGVPEKNDPYRLHLFAIASEDYKAKEDVNGSVGFGKLNYPIDDAKALRETLMAKHSNKLGRFSLGEDVYLEDNNVSTASVQDKIADLVTKATADDVILFYITGHGTTQNGEFYYVTTSVIGDDKAHIISESVPWSVFDQASKSLARVIWILDTCHSGSVIDAKSSVRSAKQAGQLVIAAASGTSEALEYEGLKHGAFSYFVPDGLEGNADGAINSDDKDQEVFINELVSYVQTNVSDLTREEQQPVSTPLELSEIIELPLVKVKQ